MEDQRITKARQKIVDLWDDADFKKVSHEEVREQQARIEYKLGRALTH